MATLLGLREQYRDPDSPDCLPDDVLERIGQIADEDLTLVVERALERGDLDPVDPEDLELEFKRYLAIALLSRRGIVPEEKVGPTETVDEVWHSFIVHTREYVDFCGRVLDGYLHHVVATPRAEGEEMRGLLNRYFEGVDADGIWSGPLFICWIFFEGEAASIGQ